MGLVDSIRRQPRTFATVSLFLICFFDSPGTFFDFLYNDIDKLLDIGVILRHAFWLFF